MKVIAVCTTQGIYHQRRRKQQLVSELLLSKRPPAHIMSYTTPQRANTAYTKRTRRHCIFLEIYDIYNYMRVIGMHVVHLE